MRFDTGLFHFLIEISKMLDTLRVAGQNALENFQGDFFLPFRVGLPGPLGDAGAAPHFRADEVENIPQKYEPERAGIAPIRQVEDLIPRKSGKR